MSDYEVETVGGLASKGFNTLQVVAVGSVEAMAAEITRLRAELRQEKELRDHHQKCGHHNLKLLQEQEAEIEGLQAELAEARKL